MTNETILAALKSNHKTLVRYFPYPTGGMGKQIASTNNWNGNEYDQELKNLVNLLVLLGASAAGKSADNKTAVEVRVEGVGPSVFCYRYDGAYHVSLGVWHKDGHEGYEINYIVGE